MRPNEPESPLKCDHTQTEIRRKRQINGKTYFARQCLRCGAHRGAVARTLAFNNGVPKDWDVDLEQEWNKRICAAWQEWRNGEQERKDSAWRAKYEMHMQSPKWFDLRRRVFERCGNVCEGCGRARAAQVHHLSYDHLGDEFLWELRAVCMDCHERVHGRKIGVS